MPVLELCHYWQGLCLVLLKPDTVKDSDCLFPARRPVTTIHWANQSNKIARLHLMAPMNYLQKFYQIFLVLKPSVRIKFAILEDNLRIRDEPPDSRHEIVAGTTDATGQI